MRKTYIACLFIFIFSGSFAQRQDYTEVGGPEVGYDNNPSFLQRSANYSLPRYGTVNELLNNKRLYSAAVRNGRLNGEWKSWYQNGALCDSGKLVKGLPDGIWKYWDADGNLIAIRNYSADKYQRIKNEMIRYHPKKAAFPLTTLYQRNRQAALRYMKASYSFAAAIDKKGDQSLPELVAKNITPGNAYKPVFDHALHHGVFINFFVNGIAKDSGSYRDGLRQGLWVHRDTADRITLTGTYANGVRIKEWKVYNEKGKLQEVLFYNSKGQLKWRKRFQRPGAVSGNV
jgi:antitoxin component YwqK of YwqJK toxin-antitoxin module